MNNPFISKDTLRAYTRYALPSVFSFTIGSIYGIVDGLFVGNVVGDAGLAAISVAWPLVQLALALGTGIGMGGAVISSIKKGEGDTEESLHAIGSTLSLLLLLSLPLMLFLVFFGKSIMVPMGASGETLTQACSYIEVIAWGVPGYVLGIGCLPLIRNRGCVKTAMAISIVGGGINVVLDWLFIVVLGWGVAGAAWATVIGQFCAALWCLGLFCTRKHREVFGYLAPKAHLALHTLKLGIAPFGLSILPELTVVVTNINANRVAGEPGVAAYAVISYIAIIVLMIIQGVGDGTQPLISYHRGSGDADMVKRILHTNFLVTVICGFAGFVLMSVFRYAIPSIFGASDYTVELIAFALPIYSASFIFYGLTHPSTSYFYAIDMPRAANSMIVGEALFAVLFITGLSLLFGLTGIWISAIAVQIGLCALALYNFRRIQKA